LFSTLTVAELKKCWLLCIVS